MRRSNSEVVKELMQTFIRIVSKETSGEFAVEAIDRAINRLKVTYSFLGYIEINKSRGLNVEEIVRVDPNIDIIMKLKLTKPVEEIFSMVVRSIYKSEGFHYVDIRAIRDAVVNDCRLILDNLNVDLKIDLALKAADRDIKGRSAEINEHIIKNSEILEPVINVLTNLLARHMEKEKAISIVIDTVRKIEKNHDFFNYVIIGNKRNERGEFPVKIMFEVKDIIFMNSSEEYYVVAISKLDEILTAKNAAAINNLIEEVGKFINIEVRHMFVEDFKAEIGDAHLAKIEEMGVKLDELDGSLQQESYGVLTRNVLETLIDIMASKTSIRFAMAAMDTMLEELRPIHDDILKYVSIDKDRYEEGKAAIIINPELDDVDLRILAMAIKGIIRKIQKNRETEEEKRAFIDEFKEQLGKRHTAELENIGINLFMVGLQFI